MKQIKWRPKKQKGSIKLRSISSKGKIEKPLARLKHKLT